MRVISLCLVVLLATAAWCVQGWAATGVQAGGPGAYRAGSGSDGQAPDRRPLDGRHCYRVGPLPDPIPADWCGCTWGAVFAHGRPVAGAQVTIDFGEQVVNGETFVDAEECFPYYGLNGWDIDLSRLDLFTVTAVYDGQTISRVVRALPDENAEQQVNLVLPAGDPPHWTHYDGSNLVRALTLHGDALWAGDAEGLAHYAQPYGCATFHDDLNLPSEEVQAAAADTSSLWAGTPAGISEYDGVAWSAHDPGLASPDIRAIAPHPNTGAVYAGANGFSTGGVSRYQGGSWQPLPDVNGSWPNTVQALLVDRAGQLWVGTDSGLSRCDGNGTACLIYTTDDGLGSKHVTALAEGTDGDVWLATGSYITSEGTRGGVSRYDSALGTWDWYTPGDGLAAWDVADVAVDSWGRVWFATWGGGVSLFDEGTIPAAWTTYTTAHGLPSNNVGSLAVDPDGIVWAGTDAGLYRFPSNVPVTFALATIDGISPPQATWGDLVTFSGSAGGVDHVLGYEWASSLDGPLGTAPAFTLEAAALSAGTHDITFRVQDGEGVWSAPAMATLVVDPVWWVYLPLVVR